MCVCVGVCVCVCVISAVIFKQDVFLLEQLLESIPDVLVLL